MHCWGGPVGMMANYHAALAGGELLVEWPRPHFELREALVVEPWRIDAGCLFRYDAPGWGVRVTPQLAAKFPFREDAVHTCRVDATKIPSVKWKP